MNCLDSDQTVRWSHGERRRRGDSGLTTLEWLLIVAAVAGLAALAVVLVTNVVGDTSEQISGQNARVTAARIAGDEVMRDAARGAGDQPAAAKTFDKWATHYTSKCNLIPITYGDAGVTTRAKFSYNDGGGGSADDPVVAADIATHPVAGGSGAGYDGTTKLADDPANGKAVAHCIVVAP